MHLRSLRLALLLSASALAAHAAPEAPTGLWAEPLDGDSVRLHWTPGAGSFGFWVDVAESANDLAREAGTFRNQLVPDPAQGQVVIDGLRAGVTHAWRVFAFDRWNGVHAYPHPRTFTTPPPGAVGPATGLVAEPAGRETVAFSWQPVRGAGGYWLELAHSRADLAARGPSFRARYVNAQARTTWPRLAPGVPLFWRVVAIAPAGGVPAWAPSPITLAADPWRARSLSATARARKLAQVLGDRDAETDAPTLNLTGARGVSGARTSVAFEHQGRTHLWFGQVTGAGGADCGALSDDREAADGLTLSIRAGRDGRFAPLTVPGTSLSNPGERPTGGFSDGVAPWLLLSSAGRSVLARSRDGGATYQRVHEVSRGRMAECKAVVVSREQLPELDLPGERFLVVFGTAAREHDTWGDGLITDGPCLAFVPLDRAGDRGAWRFLVTPGAPVLSPDEGVAQPLFQEDVLHSLSVTYEPSLGLWLAVYAPDGEGTLVVRAADRPWGPWSERERLFDAWGHRGYGRYMHVSSTCVNCPSMDDNGDAGREEVWGDVAGVQLLQRHTTGDSRAVTLRYLVGTVNPDTVVLLESTVNVTSR